MAKKCPICGKPYRDYISHIWTHKTKTVKWLAERRKNKPKKTRVSKPDVRSKGSKYCAECGKKR